MFRVLPRNRPSLLRELHALVARLLNPVPRQSTVNKKPRFFCDNCSSEVPFNAKNCPGCGRFFASIRCPHCGFTSEDNHFIQGCPRCGYSAPQRNHENRSKEEGIIEKLPFWVYVLTGTAFVAVLIALYFTVFN